MSVPSDYKTMLFLNIPVSDLQAAITFYTSLGFVQNKTFSDENAAMVSIPMDLHLDSPDSKAAHTSPLKVMLLSHPFYKGFLPADREMADPTKVSHALLCISIATKKKLDNFVEKAGSLGAKVDVCKVQDHGWMYGRSFADLDGHIWELTWMEPSGYQGKE
jgi:predicted lactoylglutathione lyase